MYLLADGCGNTVFRLVSNLQDRYDAKGSDAGLSGGFEGDRRRAGSAAARPRGRTGSRSAPDDRHRPTSRRQRVQRVGRGRRHRRLLTRFANNPHEPGDSRLDLEDVAGVMRASLVALAWRVDAHRRIGVV